MPGAPPAGVRRDLQRLAAALDGQVPAKDGSNLLIATWNLRAFGGLTSKWQSAAGDAKYRVGWSSLAFAHGTPWRHGSATARPPHEHR
jgi:hypothetical protein